MSEPKRPKSHAEFAQSVAAPRDATQEALYNPISEDELKYYKMYPAEFKDYRDVLFDDEYFKAASTVILELRKALKADGTQLTNTQTMIMRNFGSDASAIGKLAKHLAAEAQAIQREKLIRQVGVDAGLKGFN